jgi:hypothetical protein
MKEGSPCVREGVTDILPKPVPGAIAPGIAPGKVPKADPISGAREGLVAASRTNGGFIPK